MADYRSDQFFAATPPLEALRFILYEAATEPPGPALAGGPEANGRKSSSLLPIRHTCTHPLCGACAWSCRPRGPAQATAAA